MPADAPSGTTALGTASGQGPTLPPGLRHDLVNALNALLGFASFLEADLPDGEAREFARRIQQAGRQAMALAEQIPCQTTIATLRVLMVSTSADADALVLALDGLGCDVTLADGATRAIQALAKAPKAWDTVLVDQPGLFDHVGLRQAAGALPLVPRPASATAAALAVALRAAAYR